MNHKTRSFPHAFLRSFGLAAVVVAAATGTSTAQAQERSSWWLAPIVNAFNGFAEQWAEIAFHRMDIADDQLEGMRDATCGLENQEGIEAVRSVVTSIRFEDLQESLGDLPEGSWRGERFDDFLAWENDILGGSGSSETARNISMDLMIVDRVRIHRSNLRRSGEPLYNGLSHEGVVHSIRSLCEAFPGRARLEKRKRWAWSMFRVMGGLFLIGANVAASPYIQAPFAAMSVALGTQILSNGIQDLGDL